MNNKQVAYESVSTGEQKLILPPKYPFYSWKSWRLYTALLLMCMQTCQMMMAFNLSFALTCMVKPPKAILGSNISTFDEETCYLDETTAKTYGGELGWSHAQQSWLFTSLPLAAAIPTIAAGYLMDRYGPKHLVTVALLLFMVPPTLLLPTLARHLGYPAVVGLRIMIGLGYGIAGPGGATLISRWFAVNERSTAVMFWTLGNQLPPVLINPVAAYFCAQKQWDHGWPLIFYFTGTTGCAMCLLWHWLISSNPEEHPYISQNERLYIAANVPAKKKQGRVPWRAMLTCPTVWACYLNFFSTACFVKTVLSYMPTYFKTALAMDLTSNGYLSVLPFVAFIVGKSVLSISADYLKTHHSSLISQTTVCRLYNNVGLTVTAVCLVAVVNVSCTQQHLAVVIFMVSLASFSGVIPGFMTSLSVIAPPFTGSLNGIGKVFSVAGVALGPFVIGVVIETGTMEEWRYLFYGLAVMLIVSAIAFQLFGSGEPLAWAVDEIHEPLTAETTDANYYGSMVVK